VLKPITPTRKQSVYLSPRIRELSPPAGEAARPIRARSRVLGGTAGKSTASVSEKVEKVRRKKAGRPRAHQALGAAGGELKFATGTRRSRRLACTHGNAGHRGPACVLVVRREGQSRMRRGAAQETRAAAYHNAVARPSQEGAGGEKDVEVGPPPPPVCWRARLRVVVAGCKEATIGGQRRRFLERWRRALRVPRPRRPVGGTPLVGSSGLRAR